MHCTKWQRDGFDYIIVGAGSAGAVLAARLSQDPDISVLLMEAGSRDRHPLMAVPLAFPLVSNRLQNIWRYESETEPGLNGRRLPLRRGRTLGGSSSINGMIHARGDPLDYDSWRDRGLEGWSYRDVAPYFKHMEGDHYGPDALPGGDGPLGVMKVDYEGLIYDRIERAALACGLPLAKESDGAAQEGVGRVELTVRNGRRSSTSQAYLRPAMQRPNLMVLTQAKAIRILVEKGRAAGVEYRRGKQQAIAYSNREVIVSAGAFNSPQLLMLSGIGAADELRLAGISPVHDLPGVGRNLSEHPNARNVYQARNKDTFLKFLRLDRLGLAGLQWLLFKSGPLVNNGSGANIFVKSLPGQDRADIQILCVSLNPTSRIWFPGLTQPPVYTYAARGGILHPKSRGWVKLRSADPDDPPRIFFNMFGEPEDLEGMVRMMRISREIYSQSPLAGIIDRELFPGPEIKTDAALAYAIRQSATHRSHPVGTCAMGTGRDAVVDAKLKVRGIEGLRVVDASVMPDEPTGNTNIPTIMIAEKAADMICSE